MKNVIFTFCCFTSLFLQGQAPQFEWAVQLGGGTVDRGKAIATDSFGNVYTTGSFSNNATLSDTADFDPGSGFNGLVSNGGADIFVSKLSPDGELIWAVSFGDIEGDRGYGITTDASGNVYVTGLFHGSVDFDPGPGVYSLFASFDRSSVFVLKLDTNGSLLWARELGDEQGFALGSSWGRSIAVDDDGNVYTTGQARDNTDFDPGPGEYILTTNTNSTNIFISKLDSNGNFVWAKAVGGEEGEESYAIALDDFNHVYITGNFQSEIDFDSGPDEVNLTAIGNGDLFILKLNTEGEFVWVKNMGGTSTSAWGNDLVIDELGDIYTTGVFVDSVDFDPGPETYKLYSNGGDVFILKLDNFGNFIWARDIGTESISFVVGNNIALDNYGYTVRREKSLYNTVKPPE